MKASPVAWPTREVFFSQQSAQITKSSVLLASWAGNWEKLNQSRCKDTESLPCKTFPASNDLFFKTPSTMLTSPICWQRSSHSTAFSHTIWTPLHWMLQTAKWKLCGWQPLLFGYPFARQYCGNISRKSWIQASSFSFFLNSLCIVLATLWSHQYPLLKILLLQGQTLGMSLAISLYSQ